MRSAARLGTECLRRGTPYRVRGIEAEWPRRCAARFTRARCGACRARKTKSSNRSLGPWKLDLFPRLGLCVIDPHLKHGKTLLQLFRTCPGPILGRKFGFESAIDFERET